MNENKGNDSNDINKVTISNDIKLPERRELSNHNDPDFIQGEVYGFNLCIDLIQRLNPTHTFTSDSRASDTLT